MSHDKGNDLVAPGQEAEAAPIKSAPQSPPKDRDSLDTRTLHQIFFRFCGNRPDIEGKFAEEILAWHRHLSTKEMLELIGPDEDAEPERAEYGEMSRSFATKDSRNKLRAKLRAALTREEPKS